MGRRLIVGDIHASYSALRRALDNAQFDEDNDTLYSVGDFCDRGTEPIETLDYLMSLPSFKAVLGNHDAWLESFLYTKVPDTIWYRYNGGNVTAEAIAEKNDEEWNDKLKTWLSNIPATRVEEKDIIVHGGIPRNYSEEELIAIANEKRPIPMPIFTSDTYSILEDFIWDREYLESAMANGEARYNRWGERKKDLEPVKTNKTIWIGHTALYLTARPFYSEEYHLRAIDTGIGTGKGKLTVIDMDTFEYWQDK